MSTRRRDWLLALGAALMSGATHPAPDAPVGRRPLMLVVPFAAGGGSDHVARLLAARLQARLERTVVVENRPGANGLIASQAVLQQPPDGNTLLLGSFSTHVIAPLASQRNAETARATLEDYAAISIVGFAPLALAVEHSSPVRTLADYLERARAQRTTYGSFGSGSSAHLLGQIIAARTQAQLEHVPYKGSGPAVTDLLGRHVDSVILTAAGIGPQFASRQLRVLAVSSKARLPSLPGVPTFAELGHAGLADTGWFAVFIPAKAPEEAKASLATALASVTAEPSFQQRLVEGGLEPPPAGEDPRALWQRSIESARAVLSKMKFEPD